MIRENLLFLGCDLGTKYGAGDVGLPANILFIFLE